MTFNSNFCRKSCQVSTAPSRVHALPELPARGKLKDLAHIDIHPVSLRACGAYVRRGYEIFSIRVEDIDDTLTTVKDEPDLKSLVPKEYHSYLDVFSPKEAEKLPPHQDYNHEIVLEKDQKLAFGPLYSMS